MLRWVEKRFGPNCLMSECISTWLNELETRGDVIDVYDINLVTDILILVRLNVEGEEEEATYYTLETTAHNNVN